MATIRLDDAVNARMKDAAKKAGVSTTKLIEQACVQFLDGPPPRTRPAGGGPSSPTDPSICPPHPKDRLKVFSWGTVCQECGKRVS